MSDIANRFQDSVERISTFDPRQDAVPAEPLRPNRLKQTTAGVADRIYTDTDNTQIANLYQGS